MEIRQLYYVLETAKQKNFTKAAEVLYTTQPNVSKQISMLEDELDTKLFFRSHHSVLLTKDGERFCVHAQKVIDDLEALLRDFDKSRSDRVDMLNIAVFPFFERLEMAPVLRAFYKGKDNVLGTLRVAENLEAYRAMDAGDVHFAILKLRPSDRLGQFNYHQLISEKLLVMISRDHELAGRDRITNEDLDMFDFSAGEGFTSIYTGGAVHRVYSSADFLMEMMDTVGGFTFITESSAATVKSDAVTMIPLDPPVEYCTYLIYPKSSNYTGVYRQFIDYVLNNMAG